MISRTNLVTLSSAMLSLMLLISAIGGATADVPKASVRYGGTLVVRSNADPSVIMCNYDSSTAGNWAQSMFFNSLVQRDRNYKYTGDLAYAWEQSPDGKALTFHLYPNITWHDGVPLTSADVKYSVETFYGRKLTTYWSGVEAIETPDPHTVVFRLKQPSAFWSGFMAFDFGNFNVNPKHIYENTNVTTNKQNWAPVGSNAFKFVEWVRGDHITAVRNENYFRTDGEGNRLPYLDKVIQRTIPDSQSAVAALLAGEIDYLPTIPITDYESLSKEPKLIVKSFIPVYAYEDTWFFNLGANHPTANLKVRQALAHIVEGYKETLLQKARYGLGLVATGVVPPVGGSGWAYVDPSKDNEVPVYKYDPKLANQLLDEAGYPKGPDGKRFSINVVVANSRPEEIKMIEILRDIMMQEIGVQLQLKALDDQAFIHTVFELWDFDSAVRTIYNYDPASAEWLYNSAYITHLPFSNAGGYKSPVVDQAYEKGRTAATVEERRQAYRQVQIQLMKDLPAIFMVVGGEAYAVRADLRLGNPNLDWSGMYNSRIYEWAYRVTPSTATSTATTTTARPEGGVGALPTWVWAAAVVIGAIVVVAFVSIRKLKK